MYEKYRQYLTKIADLQHAIAVLQWDEEVMMPRKGASKRVQQITTLSTVVHELATSPQLGEILKKLQHDESLTPEQQLNVKRSWKDYQLKLKYPNEFVERSSFAIAQGYQAWVEARAKNDFSIFLPYLQEIVNIKREESKLIGQEGHPYDALLNLNEEGLTCAQLDKLFDSLKDSLVPLIQQIASVQELDDAFMLMPCERKKQLALTEELLLQIRFDPQAGRQDESIHPFTISFSSQDVRVTTRIEENNVVEGLFGSLHEGGHALYEQGLNSDDYGLPSGEATSLGIHESQSRLWEINVGKSLDYWYANYGLLRSCFKTFMYVPVQDFYHAINKVKPTLKRTSADELTYHFHVLIRYELEKALIEGTLEVKDLKQAWNEAYQKYLGIRPSDDNEGVLQDIHWAHGSFGYFPTYTLGSLFAAQFYAYANQDISKLSLKISNAQFTDLHEWLKKHVYVHGRSLTSNELCEKICGETLDPKYFVNYVMKKYKDIYNLS